MPENEKGIDIGAVSERFSLLCQPVIQAYREVCDRYYRPAGDNIRTLESPIFERIIFNWNKISVAEDRRSITLISGDTRSFYRETTLMIIGGNVALQQSYGNVKYNMARKFSHYEPIGNPIFVPITGITPAQVEDLIKMCAK